MTITLDDDLRKLTKAVEEAKRDKDRAEGALKASLARLKKEWDCQTVEAAEKLLKRLEREEREALDAYLKEKERFEKKWGHLLQE